MVFNSNALNLELLKKAMDKQQLMENAAARVLTKVRKRGYITPVLLTLHWLLLSLRTDFKILFTCFKGS